MNFHQSCNGTGSTHKTIVIKLLADLVVNDIYIYHTSAQSTELEEGSETCIVVD